MKNSATIALGLLASGVALLAFDLNAREMGSDEKPEKAAFADIDTNKDGLISVREANDKSGWVAANFSAIDTNRDGNISKTEFEKALS